VPIVQKVGWAPERVLATFDMCSWERRYITTQTNSMGLNPSWKTVSRADTQRIP
jgi:hypothetical protein